VCCSSPGSRTASIRCSISYTKRAPFFTFRPRYRSSSFLVRCRDTPCWPWRRNLVGHGRVLLDCDPESAPPPSPVGWPQAKLTRARGRTRWHIDNLPSDGLMLILVGHGVAGRYLLASISAAEASQYGIGSVRWKCCRTLFHSIAATTRTRVLPRLHRANCNELRICRRKVRWAFAMFLMAPAFGIFGARSVGTTFANATAAPRSGHSG
jgi:hypothetical protein